MQVNIVVPPNLEALLSRLDAAQGDAVGRAAAASAAPKLWIAFTEQAQADGRGGNFAKGWMAEPQSDTPGVTVRNTWPTARFVEKPTPAHIIRPRPGTHAVTRTTKKGTVTVQVPNMLAWVPGRGAFSAVSASKAMASAGWIRAMKVRHPATKGKNVFGIVMDGVGSDIILTALRTAATTILGA